MSQVSNRIAPGAYQALRDSLPVVFWYKRPFENFLRAALREHPELLVGLNFGDLKRKVADQLVDRMLKGEDRYRNVTLQLMLEIGSMQRFPDLEKNEDSSRLVPQAEAAVAEVRRWTESYRGDIAEQDRISAETRAKAAQQDALRKFGQDLENLKMMFLQLDKSSDAVGRGHDFEEFLNDLFRLFDMEPRLNYSLEREELDGSLSFDTDDYILEARWRKAPASREDMDVFAAKVRRKGKNALGLFVSVNGFSSDALSSYREATSFMTVDGVDLFAVLDERVRLDDLLRAKKRHANETGECYYPARLMAD